MLASQFIHGAAAMKREIALLLFLFSATAFAEFPEYVTQVNSARGESIVVQGSFSKGITISDLDWAWSSSNACFTQLQAAKYAGPHVFFTTTIPTRSVMTVTVTPHDPKQNISLYAYTIGNGEARLPPNLPLSVTCEANYKWDRPWKGQTQDHTRSVELNAISNPYTVVIGVSGPATVTSGDFDLNISVK
jgi:hypothetical protein